MEPRLTPESGSSGQEESLEIPTIPSQTMERIFKIRQNFIDLGMETVIVYLPSKFKLENDGVVDVKKTLSSDV